MSKSDLLQEKAVDWETATAPSLEDIETLATQVFRELPAKFRLCCENVVFWVMDFPDEETMETMELESEYDLLGLYYGGGVPSPPALREAVLPDKIFLYRQPLLSYWAEHGDSLGELVRHVLIHEIGHHFGFSDEDMELIEESEDGTEEEKTDSN